MRIVVATVEGILSPAHLALRAEGVKHEVETPEGVFGYWELLSRLGDAGDGFVLLEHDVVPGPGAISLLTECPEDGCVHEYPYGEPPEMLWALGAWKVTAELTEAHPGLIPRTRGEGLDHFPRGVLNSLLGPPHIHTPAFAHARSKGRGE